MSEDGWHEVARLDELLDREVRRTTVGRTELILWRHPTTGAVVAQEAWCPHAWADLKGARVTDDGCIECPWHGSRFGPDGTVRSGPATRPQPTFDVRVKGERIQVRRDEERSLRTNPV